MDGEYRQTAIAGKLSAKGTIQLVQESKVLDLLELFLKTEALTVNSPKELARRMASLGRLIHDTILLAFQEEDGGGELHNQMEGFKEVLLHDLTKEQFVDMYARTICYGLFASRCGMKEDEVFNRERAAFNLPRTNPFLKKMFSHIAGPNLDERISWAVDDLVNLLKHSEINAILADFGKRTRQEEGCISIKINILREWCRRSGNFRLVVIRSVTSG